MPQLSDMIKRLQTTSATWLQEQSLLDLALTEKVIRAIDVIATPSSTPLSMKQESVDSATVDFDFGDFTAKTYVDENTSTNVQYDTVRIVFREGVLVRESTNTLPVLHRTILNYLGLETHYQSGNSLKIEVVGARLFVTLKTKVAAA